MIAFTPGAKAARVVMDGQILQLSSENKLLGVILYEKLLFGRHVRYVLGKAMKIFDKLCIYTRPTWGAHPENVRTIYQRVIQPIITYAAGIWGHAIKKKYIQKSLLSVQRGFAIKAIRGFRTISTTAAIALAEFTPLDLAIHEVHVAEQTKLTGKTAYLPRDVDLEKPTPVAELLHPANRVSMKILDTQDKQDPGNTTGPPICCIFTDGSKQEDGSVGAAFVSYVPVNTNTRMKNTTKKYKLHKCCSVFQAELFAILKACQWATSHDTQHTHLYTHIYTDSQSSAHAIQNRSNTHPIVTQIHKIIHTHRNTHTIDMSWTRAHVGTEGNEAADAAANGAARLHKTPDYTCFPMSFVKQRVRAESLEAWQERYEGSDQGRHTILLLPKLSDIKELHKHIDRSFHLTQILTGQGYHKSYPHRFKILPDDLCPCDDSSPQTIDHMLQSCDIFAGSRYEHEALCRHYGVQPYTIQDLLKKKEAIEQLK
ncbi:uncharacterized protein [Epargyreus clarus]|uniref:uncharacterized protein n=1 Tax=Epargyreus clarus TaxID=520877 RepID=UPI003C2D3955